MNTKDAIINENISQELSNVVLDSNSKLLVYVEGEPDGIMAAAILSFKANGDIKVIFTDRHKINFDITSHQEEVKWAEHIIIVCPSINEYSIAYLRRIKKHFIYIGSSTKLKEVYPCLYDENRGLIDVDCACDKPSYINLTDTPTSPYLADIFNVSNAIIDQVGRYESKLFYQEEDWYSIMRHQYMHFSLSNEEIYDIYLHSIEKGMGDIDVPGGQERYINIYKQDAKRCNTILERANVVETSEGKIAFVQGGCPCTLMLNTVFKNLDCEFAVNVCLHKSHFTLFSKKIVSPMYDKYVKCFLYSGHVRYCAGGCFGSGYSLEEFIDAFVNHKAIHGFDRDRRDNYGTFNPLLYDWMPYGELKLYRNFNFTIFLDTGCNADCLFCIEQIKTENTGHIVKCGTITDVDEYLNRLDEVLAYIRPFNPSVSITGGEPLISSKFRGALKLLGKYNFRKTVITTNGTGIEDFVNDIIAAGISHVNVSRPHYIPEKIQHIMRFEQNANQLCSFKKIRNAFNKLEANGVRTRFNCIVSKDGIATLDDMKEYLSFAKKVGCNHVVFRELMSFNTEKSKNIEKKEYASKNRVFMNDIWSQIDEDELFSPFANVKGHYYYIEMYNYQDMSIVSERANLMCLEKDRERNKPYIYEMVFHPNGNLCAGWDENVDVLY